MTIKDFQKKLADLSKQYRLHRPVMVLVVASVIVLQPAKKIQAAPIKTNAIAQEPETQSESTFGIRGDKRWYIQGAAATNIDEDEANYFGLAGAGISQFFANGHSINAELNGIFFSQPNDDALGLNLNVLLRWHFIRQTNWSLYIDGGAGILGTTNDVPSGGASFNFTPQVGGGATIGIADDKRLMVGLRWHHISHADLFDSNPGRDSIMGYVGLNLPR